MVGGGPGAGIAETHRTAMRLDDRYVIVGGVFSRNLRNRWLQQRNYTFPRTGPTRTIRAMADAESKREDNRIDAVVIVTETGQPL